MASVVEQVAQLRRLSAAERSVTPPVPRSAKVGLQSGCEVGCRFCAAGRSAADRRSMTLPTFERIVRGLRDAGVERFGLFYMNEPFADDRLAQAIRIAKEECGVSYVFVTSSGVGATAAKLRSCLEAGLDSLKFALNFSGPVQAGSSAAISAQAFMEAIENVRLARQVRDDVFEQTGRYCRLSISSLEYDDAQRQRMGPVLQEFIGCVDEHYWLPLFGRIDHAPNDTSPGTDGSVGGLLRKAIPCWSLFTEAHVDANAELSACCLDGSARFRMGDLTEASFTQAWHGSRFRALRSAHLRGDVSTTACAQCIGYA
jgi:hypothetical protein